MYVHADDCQGECLHTVVTNGVLVRSSWHPDGQRLASLFWDQSVKIWDDQGIQFMEGSDLF
jgi:WD40 repeat protein